MIARLPTRTLTLAFGTWMLAAAAVDASVVGMRVSVMDVDQDMNTVTFDVTAFEDDNPANVVLGQELDFTQAVTYTTVLPNYYGLGTVNYLIFLGSRSDWNTVDPPAVAYGDGLTVATTTLALQGTTDLGTGPLNVYRSGSFIHTYADGGSYQIRATAGPDGEVGYPGLGDPGTVMVPEGLSQVGTLVNDFAVNRTVYATTNLATPVFMFSASTLLTYPNTIVSIMNFAKVDLGMPILEIPTLSDAFLALLALLLLTTGTFLLRRA
ncbi:MAG: hypothetical protein MI919_26015 [Holophagales bacterium]|nr:hypothetical protein [Holophagales bacterium]